MSNRKRSATVAASVAGPWPLPDGWDWVTAKAVLPLEYGKALKADARVAGPVEVFGSSGIIGFHDQALCSESAIIVGRKGSAGSVHYTKEPSFTIDTAYFCRESAAGIDLRYGYYFLQFAKLTKLDQSTAVPSLSRDTYDITPIPVPDRTTQGKIVACLDLLFSEIDDGEAALGRARADLEVYRRALLKAAVTGELTADWRANNPPRETGAELLARILANRRARWHADPKNKGQLPKTVGHPDESGLPDIPRSWKWATANQIVSETEYGTSIKCTETEAGLPVLRMGNIQDGKIDFRKLKFAPAGVRVPLLRPGDVLFNRTNSAELLGNSAVFDGAQNTFSFASYIIAVRFDRFEPALFSFWMNSSFGRSWIASNKSQQVGQANLSAGTLMRMPVPVPPLDEQIEICHRVRLALSRMEELGSEIVDSESEAQLLRQSILSAAFRGDLLPS